MCHDSDFPDGKISRDPYGLSKAGPGGFRENHPRLRLRYFPEKPCTIRVPAVMAVRKPEHWLREPVYV